MGASSISQQRKSLAQGEILIREGDKGDAAYILQSGALGVYKTVDGVELLIAVLRPGSIVGEMSILDSGPRSATVRALQHAALIRIPRDHFSRKLETVDPFTRALLQMFSQKIRKLSDTLSETEIRLRSRKQPPADLTTTAGGEPLQGGKDAKPIDEASPWRTAVLCLLRHFDPRSDCAHDDHPLTRDEVYGEILNTLAELGLGTHDIIFVDSTVDSGIEELTLEVAATTGAEPTPR